MTKEEKIQELLSVLDMSEDEQWHFLVHKDNGYISTKTQEELSSKKISLADLAFRTRDEAGKNDAVYWEQAIYRVYKKSAHRDYDNIFCWFTEFAQPIHWIIAALIAALIAKEMS